MKQKVGKKCKERKLEEQGRKVEVAHGILSLALAWFRQVHSFFLDLRQHRALLQSDLSSESTEGAAEPVTIRLLLFTKSLKLRFDLS